MTQRQAEVYCRKWMRRFRMNWRVQLILLPEEKMEGNLGLCLPDMEHRRAKVWILDSLPAPVMRRTIIHELLHALLDPMTQLGNDAAFEDGLRQLDRILHRADKRY